MPIGSSPILSRRLPMSTLLVPLALAIACVSDLRGQDTAILKSEFVYENDPFPSCHASTIVETSTGNLVAAWFGGQYEKHPEVGIWVSRKVDQQWSPPIEIANGIQYRKMDGSIVRHPTWNPVLFQPTTGPLMLFYKVGPNPRSWWGMLVTSEDHGETWGTPRRLPEGILGPIKNKPIELPNGDILCPTSTETPVTDKWKVHMEFTSDQGLTWRKTEDLNDGEQFNAIQPSVLKTGGNNLLALGRSREKKIFQIASNDSGRTWSTMTATTLPNPDSGTDAVSLSDGSHLLIYNHVIVGKDKDSWDARTPLNVATSKDGVRWQAALQLEDTPKSEFSYPAIIQTRDGLIHITYTWNRKKIRHVVVDPKRLVPKDFDGEAWPSVGPP